MVTAVNEGLRSRASEPSAPTLNSKKLLHENETASGHQDHLVKKEVWGRHSKSTWRHSFFGAGMMLFTPWIVLAFLVCNVYYGGSLLAMYNDAHHYLTTPTSKSLWQTLSATQWFPHLVPTTRTCTVFFSWLTLQFVLAVFVPGKTGYGQATPAGHTLKYNVNGLRAWVLTHAILYVAVYQLGLFRASILYDEWGALLVLANIWGLTLTVWAYAKAHLAPSHPGDCKFSGSIFYDMFMGVEQNPRFGDWFDFKLFYNGRPGIVAWSLINFSMAAKQYELYGVVTNSMVMVNGLHLIYILDFFWNEDWYLRTIDIAHDHFGYYLAWGDCVWLPFMYTLQAVYLVRNPVHLDAGVAWAILALGVGGYFIFRSVNAQKNDFRNADGKCTIWGAPATFVTCHYNTSEGVKTSKLLTSGWWGLSRHFNYVGDLMMSLSFCMCCGTQHLLPYFYIIYMTILLVNRVERDCNRLSVKYGSAWKEYCSIVKYKILPPFY